MPIPLVFIGIAAVTGTAGVGLGVKAGVDQHNANEINDDANAQIEDSVNRMDVVRQQCGASLQSLGEEKVFVLNNTIKRFLDSFQQLKNVDFKDSLGLSELSKLHIDKKDFEALSEMTKFSLSLAQGGISGVAGGALTAFGAYSAAATFASASTGTAIASLSGAAASNATLAFFGGGSLAAGGLGVAGGTAVLGGLIAGPALLVMGAIVGAKAGKNLENAHANAAKADEICEELMAGIKQCIAIRRRTYMFYSLLARLESYLLPLNQRMEEIIEKEGTDYSLFSADSKKAIASAASIAGTIKAVLDTPILNEEGNLTEESVTTLNSISAEKND